MQSLVGKICGRFEVTCAHDLLSYLRIVSAPSSHFSTLEAAPLEHRMA